MTQPRTTAADAMTRAESAHAKISAHEDLCSLRYENINNTLKRIEGSVTKVEGSVSQVAASQAGAAPRSEIDRLWVILWSTAGFMLLSLLGIIGFLLTHPGFVK